MISAKQIEKIIAAILITALGYAFVNFCIIKISFKEFFFIELTILALDRITSWISKKRGF